MAGKDGIAICATAIKAYFALTQTANTILNGDNLLEKESLLFNVNIGGKSYKGLSNIFCNKLESWESDSNIDLVEDGLLTQQLKDYLVD
jgi:hypothetical protein